MPKKGNVQDFKKKKKKVGKRKADELGTSTKTKSRKIFVPAQIRDASSEELLNPNLVSGGRRLALNDILSRCGHPAGKMRSDALSSLVLLERQEFRNASLSRSMWIGRAVEKCITMLEDSEFAVRKNVRKFLTNGLELLGPYREILAVRLAAAACSIDVQVRVDAVRTIEPLSGLLMNTIMSAERIASALKDVLGRSQDFSPDKRRAIAISIGSVIRSTMEQDQKDCASVKKMPKFYGAAEVTRGAAPGGRSWEVETVVVDLALVAISTFTSWTQEVGAAEDIVARKELAEKAIIFVEALVLISKIETDRRDEVNAAFEKEFENLYVYLSKSRASVVQEVAISVQRFEDTLVELFSSVGTELESTRDCLAEWIRSGGGLSVVPLSLACQMVGKFLSDEEKVNHWEMWLERWKKSSHHDKVRPECLDYFEESFRAIHDRCDSSNKLSLEERSREASLYKSFAGALPRLLWELVKSQAANADIELAAGKLWAVALYNRENPVGESALASGILRLIAGKKGGLTVPGPISYMPDAARSNVLGCVCFINCFYESADRGDKREMKDPFLVQLLDAFRCCFASEESLRKGLTTDLVHLMTCIPLSVSFLPNFLRTYLTAIERCIVWSREDAGKYAALTAAALKGFDASGTSISQVLRNAKNSIGEDNRFRAAIDLVL
ncbi:hypothetical protein NDN08_000762 [Rhodosorus marinus]|uniref:Pre-rRNA-processing protein Ipi1 N-terminal domain-containing protein n=1 Tax=Rhodosorus marinus TaxID=101924 RepID=A0AAV8UT48_9RHOD|nr:hypothetical protein NDN08_000762 [Rhodosorus marinus]